MNAGGCGRDELIKQHKTFRSSIEARVGMAVADGHIVRFQDETRIRGSGSFGQYLNSVC